MKTVPNVNKQLANAMQAIAALNAMNSTVTSIMIYSEVPVIRVSRDSPCVRRFKEMKSGYTMTGIDRHGRFHQGETEFYGCKVIWSESLH
ncbi:MULTISPECIES: hypothetical protein [Klebsiella/Raoultella group]|uniref:hypothetical protein n=1 Tax=Klebsiella/Raoultella group TaxID=2890311 RepID=UPI00141C3A59|nr:MULTISPECIES: hypothetical protein [Klebsiella/Raoultella group]MDV1101433.1 hypothetical protein [Raoultella ornithinolytica]CAB1217873.1 hypothetical protein SFB9_2653 [Klebsiella michiganensis]